MKRGWYQRQFRMGREYVELAGDIKGVRDHNRDEKWVVR